MRLTDCSFEYLGDHDMLGNVQRGALVSNEADDGDTKVSLMYWDDGLLRDDEGALVKEDGKYVKGRMERLRPYDGLIEATITRLDDGTFRISGISTRAQGHPAFGPDEDRVDLRVKPGPNCVNCGHD